MNNLFKTILSLLPQFMKSRQNNTNTMPKSKPESKPKQGLWNDLMRDDNDFNTMNFFLVAATLVGILMLIVPAAGLVVDIWFNHTITIDLSGLASYVIAVAGIFGAAGISNAWVEYSYERYHCNIFNGETPHQNCDHPVNEEESTFKEIDC